MQVIPAINVETVEEAIILLKRAALFVPAGGWVHIDVNERMAYGVWLMAYDFLDTLRGFLVEAHCMRADWESCSAAWFAAGAKRVIVPARHIAVNAPPEIMPSFELHDAPETFAPSFFNHPAIHLLAVEPGVSGQLFQESALEKIRVVRGLAPRAMIEVDGGITLETGRLALNAGADAVVSSSYIWGSEDPGKAYREFLTL